MSASTDRAFERTLLTAMTEDVGQPPERLLAQILGETQGMRPLPAPVALLTAPPLVLPSRVVVGFRRSRILLVAAALLVVGVALLAGALLRTPVAPPDAWTGRSGDASRAGVAISGPTGVPRVRWSFSAAGSIAATPVIAGGLVVASSLDGTLHAIELLTGVERWSAPIGANIGQPATDGTLVFVEDGGGSVHAFRLDDGSAAWTAVALGDRASIRRSPTGRSTWPRATAAWRRSTPADGSPRWQAALGASASPIAASPWRATRPRDHQRRAPRCAATRMGAKAWSAPIDAQPGGVPVVAEGLVWVGPGRQRETGTLRAYRLADGTPAWQTGDAMFAPAVAGGLAVSSSMVGVVAGRDAATGVERWRSPPRGTLRQVAIAGDTAYVLSLTERQVYGLDTATGARRWPWPWTRGPAAASRSRRACWRSGPTTAPSPCSRAGRRTSWMRRRPRPWARRRRPPGRGERGAGAGPRDPAPRGDDAVHRVGAGPRAPAGGRDERGGRHLRVRHLAPRHPHRAGRVDCGTLGRQGFRRGRVQLRDVRGRHERPRCDRRRAGRARLCL